MRLLSEQQRDAIKAKIYQTDMLAYQLRTRHILYTSLPSWLRRDTSTFLIGVNAWQNLVDARVNMPIWSNRAKRKMKGVAI